MSSAAVHARQVRASIHGAPVELTCALPSLAERVDRLLRPFVVAELPEGFVPASGLVQPYDQDQVVRHLSPTALRVPSTEGLAELWQEGERFWLIDERVGLVEINFLKNQWRSWILPRPTADEVRIVDLAVLWPMSQLLRSKGLFLLPAASFVRAGWGVLMLAPFAVESELRAVIRAGYRIVAQRWSALREEEGRLEMLGFPGEVECCHTPHLRQAQAAAPQWADLTAQHIGCSQNHAFLDAALIAQPGRRGKAHLNELAPPRAVEALRANWPLIDLHPTRRVAQLPMKLAQFARCCEIQLSRNTSDLLVLLDSLRYSRRVSFGPSAGPPPSVSLLRPLPAPAMGAAA
jgi:hypothetical protein